MSKFDNRNLARLAKLAGAPHVKEAGLVMQVRLDDYVEKDQPLLMVHAQSKGELEYALILRNFNVSIGKNTTN